MKEIIMPPLKKGDRRPSVEELADKAIKIRTAIRFTGGTLLGLGFMFIAAYLG